MRSVVLSAYGTVTQNTKRVVYYVYYGIVGPDLFLPSKELALLLSHCYWSTKKAGAHPQVSSFVQHCWRIHIYQSPAKLSIHLTAISLVSWVGNFAWEHRHTVWQWLLLLPLTLDKTKTIISFQNWKNCFLQKYNLLKLFVISPLLLWKLEFKCT